MESLTLRKTRSSLLSFVRLNWTRIMLQFQSRKVTARNNLTVCAIFPQKSAYDGRIAQKNAASTM
jgi:hypothetical protein